MLVYYDSLRGPIPCRILAVGDWSDGSSEARIQFTTTRGIWKRGQIWTTILRRVVPRTAIKRRKYSTTILPYSWEKIVRGE